MLSQKEITDSHALIVETFKELAPKLMDYYGRAAHLAKNDESPVTQLDIEIESALKNKLQAEFPVFGFKGEETDEIASSNGATWYVDPIDSTTSFIHGLPYCSNMAALVVDGEIIASIVYHFASNELFTAFKGEGAYKNGERISVKNTDLADSYVFADAYSYINLHKFYGPDKVKFYAPLGATGYFLTRVAQGSIQGACYGARPPKAKIKIHDVAPGALIVLEAGGEAVSFTEKSFDYTCSRFMIGSRNVCELTRQQLEGIKAA